MIGTISSWKVKWLSWSHHTFQKIYDRQHVLINFYRISVSLMTMDVFYLSYSNPLISSLMTYHQVCNNSEDCIIWKKTDNVQKKKDKKVNNGWQINNYTEYERLSNTNRSKFGFRWKKLRQRLLRLVITPLVSSNFFFIILFYKMLPSR
jgi:hypothetical protein